MKSLRAIILLLVVAYTSTKIYAYTMFDVEHVWYEVISMENRTVSIISVPREFEGDFEIPNSVTYKGTNFSVINIGNSAFHGCTGVTSVIIPNSITSIEYGAFWGCTGLREMKIPDSVTSIGNYAFRECSSLSSIEMPNSITNLGEGMCADCSSLTGIEIPESVTSIGRFCFDNCYGLTSMIIPNSVTSIGYQAFSGCANLSSVTIPKSMTNIDDQAFQWCYKLEDVYCYAETIPTTGTDVFGLFNYIDRATLYVPGQSLSAYKMTPPWNKFGRIIPIKVQSPIISYKEFEIHISCAIKGVKIYYTLDGSDPSQSGILYTEPIGTITPCTVKAIAKIEGYDISDVSIFNLTKVTVPEIRYVNGNVYMSVDSEDVSIYYTLDGSEPTEKSTLYKGKFEVDRNYTIKAIGYQENHINSDVVEFKVTGVKTKQPEIIYTNFQLYLTCQCENSKIYYTIDGTNPKTNGKLYTTPVPVYADCTVKAYAKSPDLDDSDISTMDINVTEFTCATPQISLAGNKVVIECSTDDVFIHYTIDGTNPSEQSERYFSPITLNHNCTVKAVAMKEGYLPSSISTYIVDWFYAATPEFDIVDNKVIIVCSTDNSIIYYTLDGTTPGDSSRTYDSPISITSGMVIKAIAYAPHYNPSDVVTLDIEDLRCIKPIINVEDNLMNISTEAEGVSFYYTLDGDDPTAAYELYKGGIRLTRNGLVKAYAAKEGLLNSETVSYCVDWFQTEMPSFSFADGLLTISCGTAGSTIYYELGEGTPSRYSEVYVQPIALTDNRSVRAMAVADGFKDSEIATYNPTMFSCEVPQFAYDGRAITISTETPGADIYYTTDGTNPTEQSNRYTGTTILNGLCTIRAIAMKDNMNNSAVNTLTLPAYYNGGNVYVETPGRMSEAFTWCSGMPEMESLTVCGKLNAADIALIKNSQSVKFLDLADVTIDELQDEALADMNLMSVAFPTARFNVGKRLLVGCNNLAAIDWNSTNKVPDDIVGDTELPNLLIYVRSASSVGSVFHNVVVGNIAEAITLHDSKSSNFYCPREFTARKITYTHNYSQKTVSGKCTGWETIALPFTPTSIRHAKNGLMTPFAANDATNKPFWLCELTESGFVNSDAIKANTPYIIAMPDNEHYADEYILAGDVTFEGSNVKVLASSDLNYGSKGDKIFIPNFMVTDKDECMALNVGEEYQGHAMGSMFVQGLRNVSPFEAYVTMEGLQSMARQIFCIDGTETGMEAIELGGISIKTGAHDILVSGTIVGDVVTLYDTAGNIVRSDVAYNENVHLKNLPKGIFLLIAQRNGMIIKSIKFSI